MRFLENGGGTGIRTQAPFDRPTGFQDRTLQPLGYSSINGNIIGGPCRTRTYDPPVMSRMLWPTELRVQLTKMVAGVGLEPTTFRVWTGCSSQLSYPAIFSNGRDDRIWTCDPLIPNQVHYQAVLHPDKNGAPSRNRTRNLLIRSQTLYPVELWAHICLLLSALIYDTKYKRIMQAFFLFFVLFLGIDG